TQVFYYSKKDYYYLIKKYFPKDQWENAYKVMIWESGGNPMAVGRAGEIGLFQIMPFSNRPPRDQLFNPEINIKFAAELYKWQGWRPWTSARKMGL
ncbi:MAG: transglycosylase SLT domain-containing protein, partial [Candidatus Nanoarchaeia archaeon]